jgi:hypothetical protein
MILMRTRRYYSLVSNQGQNTGTNIRQQYSVAVKAKGLRSFLNTERILTWGLVKAHPFYISLTDKRKEPMKIHLRCFFNRRYTGMIAEIPMGKIRMGTEDNDALVRVNQGYERLLQLGDDEPDFVDFARGLEGMEQGAGAMTLEVANREIWRKLLEQGHEK